MVMEKKKEEGEEEKEENLQNREQEWYFRKKGDFKNNVGSFQITWRLSIEGVD